MLLRTVICSVLVFSVTEFARGNSASPTTGQGFYYDAATNKYFTDGQPTFSIQPLGNAKYLESIDVSVDNGSFKPYTGKLSFQTQGLHTIRFRAVDPVLNWSPVQVFRLTIDDKSNFSPRLFVANSVDGRNFNVNSSVVSK